MAEQPPKIQIDSDWKAQAQAEKQRLADQAKTADSKPKPAAGPGGMPAADFQTLISTIVTQALFALGAIPDRNGQRFQNLDLARHHIDMLGVLEKKTKGNLTPEESEMLVTASYELRTRYIQLSSAARGV